MLRAISIESDIKVSYEGNGGMAFPQPCVPLWLLA